MDQERITPTLDWQHAVAGDWDVMVIGAGPSGAMAALESARAGLATLLIDRSDFPRFKVCGGCLNRAALAELAAVGLADLPVRLGGRALNGFKLALNGVRACIDLPNGIALSRRALDAGMVRAAIGAGSRFLPGVIATDAGTGSNRRRIALRSGHRDGMAEARWVIAADGLGGSYSRSLPGVTSRTPVQARIGLSAEPDNQTDAYTEGIIYMACHRQGYVGLVRVEQGNLHMACALDPAWLKGCESPASAVAEVLSSAGWPVPPRLADSRFRGTPRLTTTRLPVAIERVFLVGDAAGYVEPFTGEGLAWALRGGRAAGMRMAAAIAAADWMPAVAEWNEAYRRLIADRQRLCTMLAAGLRSPLRVEWAIRLVSQAPMLARPVIGMFNPAPLPAAFSAFKMDSR